MVEHGFKRSGYDRCVYYKQFGESLVNLLLYIDDMLIACKDSNLIEQVKCILKSEFEMKEPVPAKRNLGMEIVRDRKNRLLYLSQKTYMSKFIRDLV